MKYLVFIGFLFSSLLSASGEWNSAELLLKKRSNLSFEKLLSNSMDSSLLVNFLSIKKSIRPNLALVRVSTAADLKKLARELQALNSVEWAQPNYRLHLLDPINVSKPTVSHLNWQFRFTSFLEEEPKEEVDPEYLGSLPARPDEDELEEDPLSDKLWALEMIDAAAAWDIERGSPEVIVGVVDTGIDYRHEDLAANLWVNPDANAEDRHGYDFENNDPYPYDDHMHGTHTAGTVGAVGGNGQGVSGLAPAVSLMGLKFLGKTGSGDTAGAIAAIDYAVAHGARVLNNSWGSAQYEEEEEDEMNTALIEAIQRAEEADVLFVAASGNSGSDNDQLKVVPACYEMDNILAVASTNQKDRKSFFSNYGAECVDVGAPGSNIVSAVPYRENSDKKYANSSGTSMAAPHVAGLAALIFSLRPELTASQVKEIILETADANVSLEGKTVSGGRINAKKAIERARDEY